MVDANIIDNILTLVVPLSAFKLTDLVPLALPLLQFHYSGKEIKSESCEEKIKMSCKAEPDGFIFLTNPVCCCTITKFDMDVPWDPLFQKNPKRWPFLKIATIHAIGKNYVMLFVPI